MSFQQHTQGKMTVLNKSYTPKAKLPQYMASRFLYSDLNLEPNTLDYLSW